MLQGVSWCRHDSIFAQSGYWNICFFCVTSPFGTSWVSLFLADWSRFQAFLIFHFKLVLEMKEKAPLRHLEVQNGEVGYRAGGAWHKCLNFYIEIKCYVTAPTYQTIGIVAHFNPSMVSPAGASHLIFIKSSCIWIQNNFCVLGIAFPCSFFSLSRSLFPSLALSNLLVSWLIIIIALASSKIFLCLSPGP